jgi:protein-S-isoprenylcysteine O-methyltransferase Ste14
MAKDPPPKPANEAEFQYVWAMLQEFGLTERHFNEMESRYRALASTWLLASFAGMGYVAAQPRLGIDVNRWLIITLIAFAGTLGIALLWNLDLLVYHQLLDVSFEEAKHLEDIYPWLPRTRSRMVHVMPGDGILRRVVLFYIGGVGTLLGICGLSLALWVSGTSGVASLGILLATIGALAMVSRWMWAKTKSEVRVPAASTALARRLRWGRRHQ